MKVTNSLNKEITLSHTPTSYWLIQQDPDAFTLYHFYCYTASWQQSNTIKATTSFVTGALHWSKDTFYAAKKILQDAGIINDHTEKDEFGKVIGHFIEVSHPQSLPKDTGLATHSPSFPPSGLEGHKHIQEYNNLKGEKNDFLTERKELAEKRRLKKENKQKFGSSFQVKTVSAPPNEHAPLQYLQLWNIASEMNVPLSYVKAKHREILSSLQDGNRYNVVSVERTLKVWIDRGVIKGEVENLDWVGRDILRDQHPKMLAILKKRAEEAREEDQ